MKNRIEQYFDRLFPIPRSLTGNGVRESLAILSEIIDLEIKEVPTGTKALDWTIPKEWNIKEAYIITPAGERIADFAVNNLHVMGYSIPFEGNISYDELCGHIITRPDYPEVIPYATSYYNERWGFCLSHHEFLTLPKSGTYYVKIDSALTDGSMTYGEVVLKGSSAYEVLFTSYICHPSMANNELSGPLAISFLYDQIKNIPDRKYTYRFFIGPETIGAIYYLSLHGNHFKENLEAGMVVTCCGDKGNFTFKNSRCQSYLNTLVPHILKHQVGSQHFSTRKFFPMGSDERQYCSPGFDLPVACLTRSMYGEYKEYHTSADTKQVIDFDCLEETVQILTSIVKALELEGSYVNKLPYGEPQLGKRGLYPTLMSDLQRGKSLERLLYMLNYADGEHLLLAISELMNEPILAFAPEIEALQVGGLLTKEFLRLYAL